MLLVPQLLHHRYSAPAVRVSCLRPAPSRRCGDHRSCRSLRAQHACPAAVPRTARLPGTRLCGTQRQRQAAAATAGLQSRSQSHSVQSTRHDGPPWHSHRLAVRREVRRGVQAWSRVPVLHIAAQRQAAAAVHGEHRWHRLDASRPSLCGDDPHLDSFFLICVSFVPFFSFHDTIGFCLHFLFFTVFGCLLFQCIALSWTLSMCGNG